MTQLNAEQVPLAPMRAGYFVRNPCANLLFRATDAVLRLLTRFHTRLEPRRIDRILVANGAHLGDVILSTAVLPALKLRFPHARIGLLVGSWSASVVAGHPLVDWLHTVDHWQTSRSKAGRVERFRSYYRTRRQALQELRERRYDAAIDLYFYFPNSIALLWQAGIPIRIGYSSAGFGPLLSDASPLVLDDRSMLAHHHHLLTRLPTKPPIRMADLTPVLRRSHSSPLPPDGIPYIVIHMGSGSPLKDWPLPHWRTLIEALCTSGRHRLILTGQGEREHELVRMASRDLPLCVDMCGQLDWAAFVEVVAAAALLIGVDSASAHVAAAVNTPSVIVGHGMNNLFLWQPVSRQATVLRHTTPCTPCYRNNGCSTMDCIRLVSPAAVHDAAMGHLCPQANVVSSSQTFTA